MVSKRDGNYILVIQPLVHILNLQTNYMQRNHHLFVECAQQTLYTKIVLWRDKDLLFHSPDIKINDEQLNK